MKLFYAPGACSLGIHVLLEEIGAPYEAEAVDLRSGAQFKPEFTAVNPKSKVPTLALDEGAPLTEYPAIAYYLAATYPSAKLMPAAGEPMARAIEATDFCVSTMHMQGFSRIFRPANFSPSEGDADTVKARGAEIFDKGLAVMEKALEGKDWLAGEFSFADTALFYVCYWRAARLKLPLPERVAAHYARMLARPATQRAMVAEGLA